MTNRYSPSGKRKLQASASINSTARCVARCGCLRAKASGFRVITVAFAPRSKRSSAAVSASSSQYPTNPVPPVMKIDAPRSSGQMPAVWSRMCSRSDTLQFASRHQVEHFDHVIQHLLRDAGIHSHPKHVVHDEVRVVERSHHTMLDLTIRRLSQQVAGKYQPGRDLAILQKPGDLVASERRARTHRDREPEPARIGPRSRFRQNEELLQVAQPFL